MRRISPSDVSLRVKPVNNHNNTIRRSVERIEKFGHKYKYFITSSVDKYMAGERPSIRRVLLVSLARLSCLLCALRFGLSAFIDNPSMRAVMSDITYSMGNHKITAILLSMSGLTVFFMQMVMHQGEMGEKQHVYNVLYLLKYDKCPINLDPPKRKRMAFVADFWTKHLMVKSYNFLMAVTLSSYSYLSYVGYWDPKSGFSLVTICLWIVPTYLMFQQFYGMVTVGFMAWSLSAIYLRYAFDALSYRIEVCSQLRNPKFVMKAINEHKSLELLSEDLNSVLRYSIFYLYHLGSPALILDFYYVSSQYTDFIGKLVGGGIIVVVYSCVFLVNLFSSQVSGTAHRPRHYLYGYLNNMSSITIRQRFKIMAFIDKLCGPEIGFYCLDLFAMNNNEFYLYVANCVSNYIFFKQLFVSFNY